MLEVSVPSELVEALVGIMSSSCTASARGAHPAAHPDTGVGNSAHGAGAALSATSLPLPDATAGVPPAHLDDASISLEELLSTVLGADANESAFSRADSVLHDQAPFPAPALLPLPPWPIVAPPSAPRPPAAAHGKRRREDAALRERSAASQPSSRGERVAAAVGAFAPPPPELAGMPARARDPPPCRLLLPKAVDGAAPDALPCAAPPAPASGAPPDATERRAIAAFWMSHEAALRPEVEARERRAAGAKALGSRRRRRACKACGRGRIVHPLLGPRAKCMELTCACGLLCKLHAKSLHPGPLCQGECKRLLNGLMMAARLCSGGPPFGVHEPASRAA